MPLWVVGDFLQGLNRYWEPFGKNPKSIGELVGNTYRVVETFLERPT
jgi:hypothetical protein